MPSISESDPTLSNGEKQKQLDHEIREMVSALTNRLASLHNLQKAGHSSHHDDDEDDHGVRIITLAGSNIGATMRGEMEPGPDGLSMGDQEAFLTYVNNNFQAINNSIMLGGEYTANDPGVHVDISDYMEDEARPREAKKGKRKGRGNSKTDQPAEHSDYADAVDDAELNRDRTNN